LINRRALFTAAFAFLSAAKTAWGASTSAANTVRRMYNGELTANEAVDTFRSIDRLFPTRLVSKGRTIHPLDPAEQVLTTVEFRSGGARRTLSDYVAMNRVGALLILKNGRMALERYELGNTPETRWMSMSIAKSITSTLIGAALKEGFIGSLEDPVIRYVPRLVASAYEGVSVRNILMMASGVRWNETYTDARSDRRRFLEAQIEQRPGALMEVMRRLPRASPPGSVFNYSTGETQVAAEIVRGAVAKSLSQYLSERIWSRFGMQSDATWWLDSPDGLEIGGSGFSATPRDYARFGLFILNGGVVDGERIVPDHWVREAGHPHRLRGGDLSPYGYMWWPDRVGAFQAVGIFGQHLYINPPQNIVIVALSAQTKPVGGAVIDDRAFFEAVVEKLS
jgi:CubicO group peptidase (beta-lactamase class C family)